MWITRVCVNNPVFATMMMVALLVLGLVSYLRLGVEPLPDVSPPLALVQVEYPGASPAAVETEITRPLESAFNGIAGVRMIRSNSYEGRSETVVEFGLDADMGRVVQEVRDRAATVALPREARAPRISRIDGENAQPTVTLALLGGQRDLRELSLLADDVVRPRLERVDGVARVDVSGLAQRQVRVELDAQALRALALSPADIAAALQRANVDAPVGLLKGDREDALVRVQGRLAGAAGFADVVVARRGAQVVQLKDVARVGDALRERDSFARVDGRPSIGFAVFKAQDANIVRTGDALKAAAAELQPRLPPGVELRVTYANSDWVKGSLQGVQRTLVEGAALTVAIVFLFLHSWRSTVITGLALPIAVVASFIAVYAFDYTLNFMTMMALSLCIGLLVDDAIVVRENIVRHMAMGKDARRAALEGTDEIGLAVMATTFAICAVFVPVAFMQGLIGRFFHPFGITVTVAVLVSLVVSFTLDPMLSSVWPDRDAERVARWPVLGPLVRATGRFMDGAHALYEALVGWIFSPRRWRIGLLPAWGRPFDAAGRRDHQAPRRWRAATLTPRGAVLGIGAAAFVGALALVPLVGTEFVPQTDQGYVNIEIQFPQGTSLARADEKLRQVEALVRELPEVASVSARAGTAQGNLGLALKPRAERTRPQSAIEAEVRQRLAGVPGITTQVGFDRPIYVALLGPDPQVLDRITLELAQRVAAVPGITDLETSVKPGIAAFAVRLKPEAARELGLAPAELAGTLHTYVSGNVATHWTTPDGQRVEVELRLPPDQRRHASQLGALPVAWSTQGVPIALERVATLQAVDNPEVIKRQDLQRRAALYANVQGRPSGDAGADVKKIVEATTLPPGYRFDVGGATREQAEAFGALLSALGLSVVFIYIVLASQFGSFVQPLAIMASLPLALIGVMLALLVTGSTFNVFSMIGLIMLMGLVTKNAILLVDFANQARRAGAGVAEAVRQAGLARMRPILMTTAAMVFGMLPLALALNEGGELQSSMGRAIIGGVITSTLLTLVVVPVIYSYLVKDRPAAGT